MPIGTPAPGTEPPTPGAAAAEFGYDWFGRPTSSRRSRPTVGTSVGVLLKNDPRRLFYRIVNRSTGNVYIELTDQPVAATAEILGPNGGGVEVSVQEDGEAVTEAVNAIADLAGSQVHVYEMFAV